jgi:hypothetical protein
MHSPELVELAAIVSAHGPALVKSVERLSEQGLEQYWTTSKVRLDRWCRSLRNFATMAGDPKWRQVHWPRIRAIIEEILSSEMLTRVWAGVLCAHDRQHKLDEAEPIARSVMLGHLEARHRVLTLLLNTPGLDLKSAAKLSRLHERCERWTDLLVGYLISLGDLSEFAFDPAPARDFAQDLRDEGVQPGRRMVWPLILASLRGSFRQEFAAETPNADLNQRIAAGILACFPSDVFDSTGQFQSLWLLRLNNSADDAQVMIEELLGVDDSLTKKKSEIIEASFNRNRRRL